MQVPRLGLKPSLGMTSKEDPSARLKPRRFKTRRRVIPTIANPRQLWATQLLPAKGILRLRRQVRPPPLRMTTKKGSEGELRE